MTAIARAQLYIPGHPIDRTMFLVAIRTAMVLNMLDTPPEEVGRMAMHRLALAVADDGPDTMDQALSDGSAYMFAPIYGYEDAKDLNDSVYLMRWAVNGVHAITGVLPVDMAALNIVGVCTGLADRLRQLPPEFGVTEVTLHGARAIEEAVAATEAEAAKKLAEMWHKKCMQSEDLRWMQPYRATSLSELVAATGNRTAH